MFGYDIDMVSVVEEYVRENYDDDKYVMSVGYGDDVMNCLEIDGDEDDDLMMLIGDCEGGGMWEE